MGRLGVPLRLWPAFLDEIKGLPNIEVEGILSHYSMADETEGPFTRRQWKAFQEAVADCRIDGHSRQVQTYLQ